MTKLDWMITMGPPTITFSNLSILCLYPSPPTYNIAHDYISWESFSNVSYYTRILPSVPRDCPTPMGTKGNGDGVRGLRLGWVTGDAPFPLGKSKQKSNG